MLRVGFLLAGCLGLPLGAAVSPESGAWNLLGITVAEFREKWREQGFPLIRPTEYEASEVDGQVVVTGRSEDANRAMLREIKVKAPRVANLRWLWRVRGELPAAIDERSKNGDDFAARVFVVFETSIIPTRTRAINYVWSVNEGPGEVFPSPYTRHVAHIVLRDKSGADESNAWRLEQRDVLADYEKFFGESPREISGVAIMVDTDNTDSRAEADFSELFLEISPTPEASTP
ncbi:DUF3047 domain-containing protein [Opitutaceae bacterium]|nr:DUF3047 domain-containing protein [Opitutaceae bacterium]